MLRPYLEVLGKANRIKVSLAYTKHLLHPLSYLSCLSIESNSSEYNTSALSPPAGSSFKRSLLFFYEDTGVSVINIVFVGGGM